MTKKLTSRQITSRQNKIKKCRAILATEKRKFGGYHDGQGLRYIIPELYLEIEDYKGCLTYFRWFDKNFPDDCGFPSTLLIWSKALFERGKLKEAKLKLMEMGITNIYLIPILLNLDLETQNMPIRNSSMGYDWAMEDAKHLQHLMTENFTNWLHEFYPSSEYQVVIEYYIELSLKLDETKPTSERRLIIDEMSTLRESLKTM